MNKRKVAVAVGVAAVLSVAAAGAETQVGSAAPRPTRPAAHHQVLVFTASDAERTEKLILGSAGGGQGDNFIEHEALRDRRGRVGGEEAGNCLTVNADTKSPPALVQCSFTFLLADGQITTQGLVPRARFLDYVLAVTGGTGRYATARGQVTTKLSATQKHDNTITITLR